MDLFSRFLSLIFDTTYNIYMIPLFVGLCGCIVFSFLFGLFRRFF